MMKSAVVVLLALLACTALAGSGEVVELSENNFSSSTAEGIWFIKFFAPWCGHCKKMANDWESLAKSVASSSANIAEVDCTQHGSVCTAHGVRGYPTLKSFKNGKESAHHSGNRVAADLEKWLQQQHPEAFSSTQEDDDDDNNNVANGKDAPATVNYELDEGVPNLTQDNFESVISSGKWLVKFYAPWCGHCKRLAPTWSQLAKSLADQGSAQHNAKVDCTVHGDLCKQYAVRGYPTLIFFDDGKKVENYNGGRTLDEFNKYLQSK